MVFDCKRVHNLRMCDLVTILSYELNKPSLSGHHYDALSNSLSEIMTHFINEQLKGGKDLSTAYVQFTQICTNDLTWLSKSLMKSKRSFCFAEALVIMASRYHESICSVISILIHAICILLAPRGQTNVKFFEISILFDMLKEVLEISQCLINSYLMTRITVSLAKELEFSKSCCPSVLSYRIFMILSVMRVIKSREEHWDCSYLVFAILNVTSTQIPSAALKSSSQHELSSIYHQISEYENKELQALNDLHFLIMKSVHQQQGGGGNKSPHQTFKQQFGKGTKGKKNKNAASISAHELSGSEYTRYDHSCDDPSHRGTVNVLSNMSRAGTDSTDHGLQTEIDRISSFLDIAYEEKVNSTSVSYTWEHASDMWFYKRLKSPSTQCILRWFLGDYHTWLESCKQNGNVKDALLNHICGWAWWKESISNFSTIQSDVYLSSMPMYLSLDRQMIVHRMSEILTVGKISISCEKCNVHNVVTPIDTKKKNKKNISSLDAKADNIQSGSLSASDVRGVSMSVSGESFLIEIKKFLLLMSQKNINNSTLSVGRKRRGSELDECDNKETQPKMTIMEVLLYNMKEHYAALLANLKGLLATPVKTTSIKTSDYKVTDDIWSNINALFTSSCLFYLPLLTSLVSHCPYIFRGYASLQVLTHMFDMVRDIGEILNKEIYVNRTDPVTAMAQCILELLCNCSCYALIHKLDLVFQCADTSGGLQGDMTTSSQYYTYLELQDCLAHMFDDTDEEEGGYGNERDNSYLTSLNPILAAFMVVYALPLFRIHKNCLVASMSMSLPFYEKNATSLVRSRSKEIMISCSSIFSSKCPFTLCCDIQDLDLHELKSQRIFDNQEDVKGFSISNFFDSQVVEWPLILSETRTKGMVSLPNLHTCFLDDNGSWSFIKVRAFVEKCYHISRKILLQYELPNDCDIQGSTSGQVSSCLGKGRGVDIPIELCVLIMQYVSFKRVCRFACVSKSFYEASQHPIIWQALYIRRWPNTLCCKTSPVISEKLKNPDGAPRVSTVSSNSKCHCMKRWLQKKTLTFKDEIAKKRKSTPQACCVYANMDSTLLLSRTVHICGMQSAHHWRLLFEV